MNSINLTGSKVSICCIKAEVLKRVWPPLAMAEVSLSIEKTLSAIARQRKTFLRFSQS